jgi:tripartite-type tricarboxylate transporter receptor subunit TctC
MSEAGLDGFDNGRMVQVAGSSRNAASHSFSKIHHEVAVMLNDAEIRKRLLAAAAEPVGSTPEQMAQQIQTEVA